MKSFLLAILALCVCAAFSAESIGAECHGAACRLERSVRFERVRAIERDGIPKIRKTVRWLRSR